MMRNLPLPLSPSVSIIPSPWLKKFPVTAEAPGAIVRPVVDTVPVR